MTKKRFLAACLLGILSVSLSVFAGTITGQIQTATGERATLGFLEKRAVLADRRQRAGRVPPKP